MGDGSLSERFAALLAYRNAPLDIESSLLPHVRMAHWLHECIIDSKLESYPIYVLLYLQCRFAEEDSLDPALVNCGPSRLTCSATAIDQMLTVEQFYHHSS